MVDNSNESVKRFEQATNKVFNYPNYKPDIETMNSLAPHIPIQTITQIIDTAISSLQKNLDRFEDELDTLKISSSPAPYDYSEANRGSSDDCAEYANAYRNLSSQSTSSRSQISSKEKTIRQFKSAIQTLERQKDQYVQQFPVVNTTPTPLSN